MMRRFSLTIFICCLPLRALLAQFATLDALNVDFSRFESIAEDNFFNFEDSVIEDYDHYRKRVFENFAEFARNPWISVNQKPSYALSLSDRVKIDDSGAGVQVYDFSQPQKLCEASSLVRENELSSDRLDFVFYDTPLSVRVCADALPHIDSATELEIARAIGKWAIGENDNSVYDCLKIREKHRLCDWAYISMLQCLCESAVSDRNDRMMFMGLLLNQSGFKMRFVLSGSDLYVLCASDHIIYDAPVFEIDGQRYYSFVPVPQSVRICDWRTEDETPLSLNVSSPPVFSDTSSYTCRHVSKDYPDLSFTVKVNKNLIDFYGSYPASELDDNRLSRWAIYADAHLADQVSQSIYPILQDELRGKSDIEAVNMLLNLMQTGFGYKIDNEVWGRERIFFAEETLVYPYCDCEDRAVLFTRMVRDVLHLDCALVCYPGHMAAAVRFDEEVVGDYILVNGLRYMIADPTYIGATVGVSMPNIDKTSINVIKLNN